MRAELDRARDATDFLIRSADWRPLWQLKTSGVPPHSASPTTRTTSSRRQSTLLRASHSKPHSSSSAEKSRGVTKKSSMRSGSPERLRTAATLALQQIGRRKPTSTIGHRRRTESDRTGRRTVVQQAHTMCDSEQMPGQLESTVIAEADQLDQNRERTRQTLSIQGLGRHRPLAGGVWKGFPGSAVQLQLFDRRNGGRAASLALLPRSPVPLKGVRSCICAA